MRKMKDSGIEWIGEIPENWNYIRGKNLYSIATGKRDSGENDENGAYAFFTCSAEAKLINSYCYDGEVLLISGNGIVGFTRYYNGKFDAYQRTYYFYNFRKDIINIRFLYHYVSNMLVKFLENQYVGSVIDFIKLGDLKNFIIIIPTVEDQQRIAKFLDDKCSKINRYIEKQQQIIEKLKEYKQSVITEAVAYRDGWTKCHLGYLAQFKNGLNYSGLSTDIEIKFLGVGDFQNHFSLNCKEMFSTLRFDGNMPEDLLLKSGDIVFVRSNGSKELVGRSVLIENVDYPLTYSGFCIRMRNCRQDVVQNKFLMYRFWSNEFRQSLNRDSRGSNINNLNQELLSNLTVVFPGADEQALIVEYLDKKCAEIDITIEKKQSLVDKLQEYKKSLIYEAVTGKTNI